MRKATNSLWEKISCKWMNNYHLFTLGNVVSVMYNLPVVFSNGCFLRKLFSFHFLLLLLRAGIAIHYPVYKGKSSEGKDDKDDITTHLRTTETTELSMWCHMLSSRPYWGKTRFSIHLACFAKQSFFFPWSNNSTLIETSKQGWSSRPQTTKILWCSSIKESCSSFEASTGTDFHTF